jgi:hypothetical protein
MFVDRPIPDNVRIGRCCYTSGTVSFVAVAFINS